MLELRNVSYEVEGDKGDNKEILSHINFVFDKRFTAITGPNGGGKSTLLSIMAGTLRPVSGSI
ncbi:MAG: ATP-binding cassette domain-containing protein, partial [Lachnospiraceae bacterium]|nr:ATP-binding cassette domain-containing protein [Lachnospiraceae bacterium]